MSRCLILITLSLIYMSGAHAADEFQTLDRDTQFKTLIEGMDLESPAYAFTYKVKGTSLGFHVKQDGKSLGKFLPINSAGNPEAQVVAYQLARFLNMDELVIPAAYYTLGAKATARFRALLAGANEHNKWRNYNKTEILKQIGAHPGQLSGAFMPKEHPDSFEVASLANDSANTINGGHPIAQFIQAGGPMPQKTRPMSFKNIKTKDGKIPQESEWELSREFSEIMVLDILCGEWDRWSGGNVEATYNQQTGKLQFIARDNGGASVVGTAGVQKYFGIVSRFDRAQIERVKHLVALMSGPEGAAFAKSLGLHSDPRTLVQRANLLLAHVARVAQTHGEDKTFF